MNKDARDFRVFWQHLETLNSGTYPKQEPLMTYDEAKKAAQEEHDKGYLRSWVIDRRGLMV